MKHDVKKFKQYHHGNLKDALLAAARMLLEKDGLKDLSLRKCAASVGVSQTAPQNHFKNKTGLLTAMAAQGYAELAEQMNSGAGEDSNRSKRRAGALTGYVEFAKQNPALYELMFARKHLLDDDEALNQKIDICFSTLVDISKGLAGYDADDPLTEPKSQMLVWSFVHGYAQLLTANRFKKESMEGLDILDIFPPKL